MVSALAVLLLLAAAPALAEASPPTPELIQRAEDAGRLDRSRADLFRTYAIAVPERLPAAFRSDAPWDGTLTLLRVRHDLPKLRRAERERIQALFDATAAAGSSCGTESSNQANVQDTNHFHITYGTVDAGLTINDYADSLEQAWATEVDSFDWAAPPVSPDPAPGNRYHVRIDQLGAGLYGYVTNVGTHAGLVGDNPSTAWDEGDAYASCMVLNRDYGGFPSPPQAALDSTTAHEFNHSIQYGYGTLIPFGATDEVFVEGGATWMEDEVQDAANDNYHYLWPVFGESMGDYDPEDFAYPYWITFRGLTERYGSGSPGGAEQVMQDFWELTSRNVQNNQGAVAAALAARGTTLADAFHAYAIAVKFNRPCGGGYAYPYCFEEGPGYESVAQATPVDASIASVGGSAASSVEDNYALAWVALPASSGQYSVTLNNTSSGGQLRGSIACDTGTGLRLNGLPNVAASRGSSTFAGFSPAGCLAQVLVVTNQSQTAANPSTSTARSFSVVTQAFTGNGQDTDPPETTITGGPAGTTNDSTPTFTFDSDEANSTFVCQVDQGLALPCNSPHTTETLASGQHVFSVYARDSAGNADPTPATRVFTVAVGAGGGAGGDFVAPVISRLRLSPTRFRAARNGAPLAAAVGTRLSLTLSENATVTFRVSRLVLGRRVNGRCVRPTARNRRARRCTRSVRLRGRIVRQLAAGTTKLRYRGRLGRRRLRPGRYVLRAQARDRVGNGSGVRRASFTIVR